MKRKHIYPLIMINLLFICGCATVSRERLCFVAPSVLPNTTRDMKTAGFWVSRITDPDRIIMNDDDINKLNAKNFKYGLWSDPAVGLPLSRDGQKLKQEFERSLESIKTKKYFRESGDVADDEFFQKIRENMDLGTISDELIGQAAFVVHYTDQRVLPTEEPLNEIVHDIDFDELQNSALDAATPIVIICHSKDGQWVYAETELTAGWLKAENVAVSPSKDEVRAYLASKDFVVVVSPKAEIFLDPKKHEYYDYAQMGCRFPFKQTDGRTAEVLIPVRDDKGNLNVRSGFIDSSDLNVGYLPYSPRNVIDQAFKLLNMPYGWGGMYGEQDCSRFLQQIFSVFGIQFPRNSSEQAKVGSLLGEFNSMTTISEKLKVLEQKGAPGITILPMKGHIMLYLGTVDNRPYAIHATWAYRENKDGKDVVRVLNRVVVSDLSLGEGSSKGSLLQRLISIRIIK